jgi:RNA polymerase sigma-70 factor, ECF subfamily
MADPSEITLLLSRAKAGDAAAQQDLYTALYSELHRIARAHMAAQADAHTLQPTALLHEAWLRLSKSDEGWNGREHFLSVASRAMRHVLVDHARRRRTGKRDPGTLLPFEDALARFEQRGVDLVELDDVLGQLAAVDPELARIVDMLHFGGMTMVEVATALGVSVRTVERGWRTAKAYLHARLNGPDFEVG